MHWSFCQKKMQKLSMRILLAHHSCSKWQKIAPYICSCTWLGPSNREAMNNSHMHQESSLLCNQNLTLIEYWFHGIQLQWSCRCRLFRICNSVVACSSMLYRTAGSKRREREKLKKSLLSFRNTKLPDTLKKSHLFFPQIWGFYGLFPPSFWSIWATPTWDSSQSLAPGVDVGWITRLARSQWPSILVQYVFI